MIGLVFFEDAITPEWYMEPSIQWAPGALSLAVRQLGHEADHSPSSAKVKNL
jgi:hypothetical protein